jgi:hypothetical protein
MAVELCPIRKRNDTMQPMNIYRTAALGIPVLLVSVLLNDHTAGAQESAVVDGSARRIRAHVAFLADDLLEGRQAGTRGYDLAAGYVAAQYAQLGLEPAGDAGGWLQSVPMVEAAAVIPAAKITLQRGGANVELTAMDDFLPSPNTNAPLATVTAPLVFVGFGVHAPALSHDDLAGLDLRGKVVVVLGGAPAKFTPSTRAHHSSTLTKYPEFVNRGAVGVLSFSTSADLERNPWSQSLQSSWRPRMRWLHANGQAADSFPQLQAAFGLSPAGAAKIFAAAAKSLDDVQADAAAGHPQGFDLPGVATLSRQSLLAKRQSANVVGLLRGRDAKLADEYIVVTAHLDHLGKGAPVKGDSIYNGAMDNASGIGVMLETARALALLRPGLRRSVLFVAVTAEESGLLGSDYFARNPTVKGSLVANVNIDMPVALTEMADVIGFGAEHTSLGPIAARAARAEGLKLSPDPMPEETVFVRSDQYSFVRRGIPAIYLDAGLASRPRQPAVDTRALFQDFLRDKYHQPGDDLSQPIHYPSLARLARINARIATEIANNREPPRWNEGDFFGSMFGPRPVR